MALHRDIFWLGKQWAVTGYGVQVCDQRQKSKFDIEASQVWEDGVVESLRAQPWLNHDDLDKALAVARKRYPEPPRKPVSVEVSVSRPPGSDPVEQPKPPAPKFDMRADGLAAKLGPLWRVRARR
jgi:hypothetical protein